LLMTDRKEYMRWYHREVTKKRPERLERTRQRALEYFYKHHEKMLEYARARRKNNRVKKAKEV
jgi:predicted solute-binding protein